MHTTARIVTGEKSSVATALQTEPPVPLQLFNADGSVRLPDAVPRLGKSTSQQLGAELMQRGHNVLHCRQTRFASGYERDESAGDGIARKYLSWVGLYNTEFVERQAARRAADAATACDG